MCLLVTFLITVKLQQAKRMLCFQALNRLTEVYMGNQVCKICFSHVQVNVLEFE